MGWIPSIERRGLSQRKKSGGASLAMQAGLAENQEYFSGRGFASLLSYAFWLVFLIAFLHPAVAQISPGALSQAHQSLNGTTNCTTCHKLAAGQATFKCVE